MSEADHHKGDLEPTEELLDGVDELQGLPVIRVYGSRWHMLAIFASITFANAFIWITFAPISDDTKIYYGVDSDIHINLLSMSFMMLYLPGSIACAYLIQQHGLRANLIIGSLLNVAATALRLGSTTLAPHSSGYALLLFGQCLAAFSQPFFTNTCTKMAGTWFPADEQNTATTIAALVSPVGNALGQVIPSVLVSCADDTITCERHNISGFVTLMILQLGLSAAACLWIFTCFRAAPAHFPSEAAHEAAVRAGHTSTNEASREVLRQIRACCWDPQFAILTISFGIGLGIFQALLTVDEQLIRPVFQQQMPDGTYSLDEDDAQSYSGLYGGVLIGAGLVSSAVIGPVLDRLHAYKTVLKSGLLGILGAVIALFLTLRPGSTWHALTAVCFGLLGVFMVPILPTALEVGVECTYPVPEEYSSGVLMLAGQLFGIAFTFAMPPLIDLRSNWHTDSTQFTAVAIFVISSGVVGAVFMFIFDGEYKRLNTERALEAEHSQRATMCSEASPTSKDEDRETEQTINSHNK